jgi:hypothetical protein
MHELEFQESHDNAHKKELSENSCPIIINNEEREDFFSPGG